MEATIDLSVPEETILDACGETALPEFGVIEQIWETDPILEDRIADRTGQEVNALALEDVPDGGEVAVGVGSRGIANLPALVRGVVERLDELGYQPFIFPAMGSHGGATAEGQQEMIESLGVTESRVGCEIRSSMEVVKVGETPDRGVEVVADEHAAAADAILPINRVKPHTDFDGAVESGLSKMLVIGMGKQRGAKTAHEWAIDWSFRNMIPEITEQLLDALPIVGGVAVVEDQHDETTLIEGIRPEGFLDREAELLETAYEIMPTLPFGEVDVLVLDRQGKDVSGQGLDTNVIGRRPFAINEPEPERPDVKRIFVRRLTETTHGNAMGMGSADFVHADLFADLNSDDTLINAITASTIRGVRLPPVVETDRAGLIASLSTIGVVDPDEVRVLRAADTMHLGTLYASQALVEEARQRDDLRVVREPEPIEFDDGQFENPAPHIAF
ncbi:MULTISPECIES: nickel pincer cofactor-dependent isomerase, group 22 [Natrialbaceae]|uniref:lactate racemase domain-containing protein n=1 Tax=Natrialbaceae TaxID=1644061 RepID=UPI00207C3942|nr:lactate racemase domain-containing protein [Natronococcus sp. CG52]